MLTDKGESSQRHMIILTKRLAPSVVCCSDRYGFVVLADMTLQADSDKGHDDAVADGASQNRPGKSI